MHRAMLFDRGLSYSSAASWFVSAILERLKTLPGVVDVRLAGGAVRDKFFFVARHKDLDFFIQLAEDKEELTEEDLRHVSGPWTDAVTRNYIVNRGVGWERLDTEDYKGEVHTQKFTTKLLSVHSSMLFAENENRQIIRDDVIQLMATHDKLDAVIEEFDYGFNKISYDGKQVLVTPHFVQDFFANNITLSKHLSMTDKLAFRFNKLAWRVGDDNRVVRDEFGEFHKGHFVTVYPIQDGTIAMCLSEDQEHAVRQGGRDPMLNGPMVDALAYMRAPVENIAGGQATAAPRHTRRYWYGDFQVGEQGLQEAVPTIAVAGDAHVDYAQAPTPQPRAVTQAVFDEALRALRANRVQREAQNQEAQAMNQVYARNYYRGNNG